MRQPPTGEPCAGEPPARFGGRGGREPFPTPMHGKRATTHWRFLDSMQKLFPKVTVEKRLHFVEEGALFSSAGISAGIDMTLRVVARYYGEAVARATAR